MADAINIKDSSGVTVPVSVDDVTMLNGATVDTHVQRFKAVFGTDGVGQDVDPTHPLPVTPSSSGDVAATLTDGRKTVSTPGTAVALRGALACKWVCVTALTSNTGQVNVGAAGVLATLGSSTGTPLAAGESLTIPVDDAAKVFVDARVANEGVSFTVGS